MRSLSRRAIGILFIVSVFVFVSCASGTPPAAADAPLDASYAGQISSLTEDASIVVGEDASVADPVLDDADIEDALADAGGSPEDVGLSVPPDLCPTSVGPGDLAIDELMIASLSGASDFGEWLEVRSTRACTLDLRALHAETPRADRVITLDIPTDTPIWLSPLATFVIADSLTSAVNHDLPGLVFAWDQSIGDVLRNEGGTITLTFDGLIVDSVTYPLLPHTIGTSIAFPSDCAGSDRSIWKGVWQSSTSSWFPNFYGTPNAPNDDVHCPADP